MLRLILALLIAAPALAQTAHSGATASRSMPELSDIALFVLAAFSIWFVRRALRRRFRRADAQD
jgi:ABC-type nickel/cobalt efflux system permease component RcnA